MHVHRAPESRGDLDRNFALDFQALRCAREQCGLAAAQWMSNCGCHHGGDTAGWARASLACTHPTSEGEGLEVMAGFHLQEGS